MTKHIHGQVNELFGVVGGVGEVEPGKEPVIRWVTIQGDSDVPGSKKKVHLRVPIEHLPGLIEQLQRFLKYAQEARQQ